MSLRDLKRPEDHSRLELVLEAAGLGAYEWEVEADLFTVSPRLSEMTGLPPGTVSARGGEVSDPFIHPDDLEAFRQQRQHHRTVGGPFEGEYRIVRPDDGRVVWLHCAGVAVMDQEGRLACVSAVVQDVTGRHREEEQRQHLMAELDHRVKNVLAAVQALAQQTAKRTTSLDAFLQTFGGRLKAMASANELLTAARWRGAAVDHLVAAELGALSPGQTSWNGPELFLTPRAANALSLALHELATNAVKFGALSQDTGHVAVRWSASPRGGFELSWIETGGPTVSPPSRRGFGSTLLEQVTPREINGEARVDFRPAGVSVHLRAGPQAVAPRPENVPEAPARPVETVVTPRVAAGLRGARILIVEDAVLLALELETGLSEAGAEVVGPAYELEEAMALLDQQIDAAVLDANLNGHSVTPVAQALHARNVPFVFATGYGETGGASLEFEAPVIRKPYDVTQVAAAVAELLAAS